MSYHTTDEQEGDTWASSMNLLLETSEYDLGIVEPWELPNVSVL